MLKHNLILIRHGQSLWNKENRFTGWEDIDLSEQGIAEAKRAGQMLKEKDIPFNQAFTSVLKRAISTLDYVLKELELTSLPITKSRALNERHYGQLQGKNKQALVEEHGKEQVQKWRRDFFTKPPPLIKAEPSTNRTFPHEERVIVIPASESLKNTFDRVLLFWKKNIFPPIKQGQSCLIVAHGNSLRALIKHLENISDSDISSLEVQTGQPIGYHIDSTGKISNKEVYG